MSNSWHKRDHISPKEFGVRVTQVPDESLQSTTMNCNFAMISLCQECFYDWFYVHFLISACADLVGESPEIKNWKSLWTSLSDAKIGQIWVYHVARVLGEETHLALSWATTVGQTLNPDSNLILNWPKTKYKPSLKKRTENSQLVVVADDNAYCHLRHLSGHFCLSYSWLSCWAVILFDQWSYGWSSSSSWVVALLTWLSPSGHLHERSGGRCQANITLIIFTTSSGVSSTILLVHQLDYC